MKRVRLLAEWKAPRAIDQMHLRCLLPARNDVEQNKTGLSGSCGVIIGPDDLGRYRHASVAAYFPKERFGPVHARSEALGKVGGHGLRGLTVRFAGASGDTGVE